MRLSRMEELGRKKEGEVTPTYDYGWDAPRRTVRAVKLINEYDGRYDRNFKTYEDRPVFWATGASSLAVVVPVMLGTFWLMGFDRLTDVVMDGHLDRLPEMALATLVGALAAMVVDGLGWFVWRESVTNFLASRIFKVPAKPRLYIKQGLHNGNVWRTNADADETEGALSSDDGEPLSGPGGENFAPHRVDDDGNNDPWGYPQFRP